MSTHNPDNPDRPGRDRQPGLPPGQQPGQQPVAEGAAAPALTLEDTAAPELALEDTAAQRRRGLPVRAGGVVGYNPYDTGPPAAGSGPSAPPGEPAPPPRKRTDLRKLSEWIRLQREVEALKNTDHDESDEG